MRGPLLANAAGRLKKNGGAQDYEGRHKGKGGCDMQTHIYVCVCMYMYMYKERLRCVLRESRE